MKRKFFVLLCRHARPSIVCFIYIYKAHGYIFSVALCEQGSRYRCSICTDSNRTNLDEDSSLCRPSLPFSFSSLFLVLSPPLGLLASGISSEFLCSPAGDINDWERNVHHDPSIEIETA